MSDSRDEGLDYTSLRAVLATQNERAMRDKHSKRIKSKQIELTEQNISKIYEMSSEIAQIFASREGGSKQERLDDFAELLTRIRKNKASQVDFYAMITSLYKSITEKPTILDIGYTFESMTSLLSNTRTAQNVQALLAAIRSESAAILLRHKFYGFDKKGKRKKVNFITLKGMRTILYQVTHKHAMQTLEILGNPDNLRLFDEIGFCARNITSIFVDVGGNTQSIIDALRKYQHLISDSDPTKFRASEVASLLNACKGNAEERLQAAIQYLEDPLIDLNPPQVVRILVKNGKRSPKGMQELIGKETQALKQEPYNLSEHEAAMMLSKSSKGCDGVRKMASKVKRYKKTLTELGFDDKVTIRLIYLCGQSEGELEDIVERVRRMQERYGLTKRHIETIFPAVGSFRSLITIPQVITVLDSVEKCIKQFGKLTSSRTSPSSDESEHVKILSLDEIARIFCHSTKTAEAYLKALQDHVETLIDFDWSGRSIATLCEKARSHLPVVLHTVAKNLEALMNEKRFEVSNITCMLHDKSKSVIAIIKLVLKVADELISYGFIPENMSMLVARGDHQKNIDFALALGRTLVALGFEQKQLQDVLSSYSTKDTLMIMMDLYECYDKTCKAPAQMLERYRGLPPFSESMSMFDIKYVQSFLEARGEVVPKPDLERIERKRKQPLIDMAEYKEVLISASVDTGRNRGKRMMDDLVRVYQYGKEKLQQLVSQFPQDKQNTVLEALHGFSSRLLDKGHSPDGLLELLGGMKSWQLVMEYVTETAYMYDRQPSVILGSARGMRCAASQGPHVMAKRSPSSQSVSASLDTAPDEGSSPESVRGIRLRGGSWQSHVREQQMLSAKRSPSLRVMSHV